MDDDHNLVVGTPLKKFFNINQTTMVLPFEFCLNPDNHDNMTTVRLKRDREPLLFLQPYPRHHQLTNLLPHFKSLIIIKPIMNSSV